MEEKSTPPDVATADVTSALAPNMRKCPACGQEYNADHALEYFHHNEPGPHEPIQLNNK